MALYTFMLEFNGGSYISQVKASSPKSAIGVWAKKLNTNDITGLGPSGKTQLISSLKEDTPVAIAGVLNTWCSIAWMRGKLAIIYFVKTDVS